MDQSFKNIVSRTLTSIDTPENIQDTLWLISNTYTFLNLINLAFVIVPTLVIPHFETMVKILTLDCQQILLYSSFKLLFAILVAYILLLPFFFIVGVFKSKVRAYDSIFIKIARVLAAVHMHVLFVPSCTVLSFVLSESITNTTYSMWAYSENINSLMIITAFCMVISFAFMVCCTIFHFNPSWRGLASRRPSLIDFYKIWAKSSYLLLRILQKVGNTNNYWFLIAIISLIELIIIFIESTDPPYYSHKTIEILSIFSSFNLATLLVTFLYTVFTIEGISPLLLWILLSGSIFQILKYTRKLDPLICFQEPIKKTTFGNSFRRLSYITNLLENKRNITPNSHMDFSLSDLAMTLIVENHSLKCSNDKCFHKFYLEGYKEKITRKILEKNYYEFIDMTIVDFFKREMDSNKQKCWLKLALARRILNKDLTYFPMILSYLTQIGKSEKSCFTQIVCDDITFKISEYLSQRNKAEDSDADVLKFIDYKIAQKSFKMQLKNNIKSTVEFWVEYQSDMPTLAKLFKISLEINREDDRIRNTFFNLKSQYQNLMVNDYVLYGAYCIIARNSDTEGYEIIKEYQNRFKQMIYQLQKIKKITNDTIHDQRNATITVGIEKNKLGVISNASGGSFELFGYVPDELKGMKINTLMPKHIAQVHDEYIYQHLQKGTDKLYFKNRILHSINKQGFLKPIYIILCLSPQVEKNIEYIGLIRPMNEYSEYIMYEPSGDILGCSEDISGELMINMKTGKTYNIEEFCPMFRDVTRIITTCEWVKNSFKKEGLSFETIHLKFQDHLRKKNLDERDFCMPGNEAGYNSMLELYERFYREGITLNFNVEGEILEYFCKISNEDKERKSKIKNLLLRKKYNKSATTAFNRKDTIKLTNTNDQIVQTFTEIAAKTKFEAQNDEGNHRQFQIMKTRMNSIYLPRHDNSEHSIGSVNSQNLSEYRRPVTSHLSRSTLKLEPRKNFKNDTLALTKLIDEETGNKLIISRTELLNSDLSRTGDIIFKDKNQIYMDLVENSKVVEEGSLMSVTRARAISKRLKQRINKPKTDLGTVLVGLLTAIFYSALIITLLGYYIKSNTISSELQVILNGLTASTERTNYLLLLNSATRILDSKNKNILYEVFPGFIAFMQGYALTNIQTNLNNIKKVEPAIKNTYQFLPANYMEMIMEEIQIHAIRAQEAPIKLPLDQVFSLLEASGWTILKNPFKKNLIPISEILSNSFDDTLIRSDTVPRVFLRQIRDLVEESQNFLKYLVIAQGLAMIVLLVVFILVTSVQFKYRIDFLESFIKIEEYKLNSHITRLKNFNEIAHKEGTNKGIVAELAKKKAKDPQGSHHKVVRRKYNEKGLNLESWLRILLQVSIYIITFFCVLFFWRIVVDYTDSFLKSCENVGLNDYIFGEYILLLNGINNYVLENNSTLRNVPITTEFWKDIEYLEMNQEYYNNFDGANNLKSKIMEIVQSNFCERYRSAFGPFVSCDTMAGGALRYGLNGMTSFIVKNIRIMLKNFDKSSKTYLDITKFFIQNTFFDLQRLLLYVVTLPFIEISNLLKIDANNTLDVIESTIWMINIIYLLLATVLAGFSIILTKRIHSEKYNTQRALNLIPINVIVDTPLIARFVKEDIF